jgi:outer membrane lipoprotein-sorting protein
MKLNRLTRFMTALPFLLSECSGILALDDTRTSTGLTAQEVVERADQARNGNASVLVKTRISYFKSDRLDQENVYEIYAKGSEKALLKSLDPRNRGSRILMLGDDMWISLPDVTRPVRITPAQRLVGQASNGDVARTYYAADYEAQLIREEEIGRRKCALMNLKAKRKGATYQRIEYWVDLATLEPVQANFYLTSGRNAKFASFDEFKTFMGHRMISRITIVDRIQGRDKTIIEYLSAEPRAFPDRYFNINRISEF